MARARVVLSNAQSHVRGNRTFKKGVPEILTDEDEIAYYKAQSQFTVTMLKDPTRPAEAAPVTRKPKKATTDDDEEAPI